MAQTEGITYFFVYEFTMGTGGKGIGNCVLKMDREIKTYAEILYLQNKVLREREFTPEYSVGDITITNFIKL